MEPWQAWASIRRDHQALLERLAEVDLLAARLEDGDEEAGVLLMERGAALYRSFAAHLRREEELLRRVLTALPRSQRRALTDFLRREHREQRELLAYVTERLRLPSRPPVLVGRDLRAFASCMRTEMAREERLFASSAAAGD